MLIKYRVHEVAKDFGLTGKEITAILAEHFEEPKKSMTALTEEELDIVFETLTQQHQVENFDEYFAIGERARQEREAQRKAEQEARLEQQRQLAEELKAAAAAAAGAAQTAPQKQDKTGAKAGSEQPAAKKPTLQEQAAARAKEQSKAQASQPASKPFTKKPESEKAQGQAPKRGPAEIHRIDTRTTQVNLDKYNEKYEQIAPQRAISDRTATPTKQKIRQKSQNYRRPANAKRETEADKLRKLQLERIKKTPITVTVGDEITVAELASRMKKTAAEVVKQLMKLGMMVTATETIDYDTAEIVVTEMGAKIKREVVISIEERIMDITEDTDENLRPRNPIVVVMGHVDHGKTSLLDKIRGDNVTATEAGGITQHIGAYRVPVGDREITFLDTPGHSAFTAMRARGAQVTDIAILVVAADDGIMPQTVEAINHAKAAGVQIVVALNKIDKPTANVERILQQLTEYSLIPEEWGGETICVPVSAHTGEGIDKLLESVMLLAEMAELRANPDRRARGTVIEARLDKGRGPVATLLVQNGTLRTGDILVAGTAVGRVRAMIDDQGRRVEEAGPSVPVEITGLAEVPAAGDAFDAVSDERLARELVEQRKHENKVRQQSAATRVTLDNLFDQLSQGDVKELNVIVKADVQGSVEALRQSLEKLSNNEVRVVVIHGGVGAINESDVTLAEVSNAIIVGFNVRPDPLATENAQIKNVDMRMYRVIYDCIEEIEAAIKGMLAPKFREVNIGRIEVRQVYKISSVGTVAGCYVLDGKVTRASQIRVVRDGIVITEDKIDSLRRFKDDVKEVAQGYECGIGLDKFSDIKEGDIFEAFVIEEYRD